MYKNLCAWVFPGGHDLRLEDIITLAKKTGYDSIEIPIGQVKDRLAAGLEKQVKDLFSAAGIIPAGWQVDDRWRAEGKGYEDLLNELPALAKAAQTLNCRRAFLWMPSYSDDRDYEENFAWHVKRLKPIAKIVKQFGGRLGLEWQGPKTLWKGHKYIFIHTLAGTLELIRAIGEDNVGLLLDIWHVYTAQDRLVDLRKLKADDIVYVHISDAPLGVPFDEHRDEIREVPGATGVIDLVGFFKCLKEMGYQGPVEPSVVGSKILAGKTIEEGARINSMALGELFRKAGIKE
jgi:sugar phosphate isomerase/epimerase